MVPFNETILQTREKRFHLGFQRILLCFYVMMGLFKSVGKVLCCTFSTSIWW